MPFEYVPCNQCGSEDHQKIYEGNLREEETADRGAFACTTTAFGRSGPVVRCRRCGLVFLNPRLTTGDILEAYAEVVDAAYLDEKPAQMVTFAEELRALERHAAARSGLIDIGTHVGTFLEAALERGWTDVMGVEPSRWGATRAAERGLKVLPSNLMDARLPAASKEAATMWDVIEHFSDPMAEVREIHRVLKPGGVLGLCTMNVESLLARVLGRRWPFYLQSHLYYFSPTTLSEMLARAGFRTLEVKPHRRHSRLASFVARMKGWLPPAGATMEFAVARLGWEQRIITIDLHDFFTLFARRE